MYGTLKSDVLGLRMNTFKDRRLNIYKLIKPLIAKKNKFLCVHLLNLDFCSLNKQSLLILIILIILIILTIR